MNVKLSFGVHEGNLIHLWQVNDGFNQILFWVFFGVEKELLEQLFDRVGGCQGNLLVFVNDLIDMLLLMVLGAQNQGSEMFLKLKGVEIVVVLECLDFWLDYRFEWSRKHIPGRAESTQTSELVVWGRVETILVVVKDVAHVMYVLYIRCMKRY